MSKKYWLFKTEPDAFSIDDLAASPQQTTAWDGIRNYQARNFLRDQMQCGDEVLIYHSSCKNLGIVGTAAVVKQAYHDPLQFNPESRYYDPKSSQTEPRWFCVDIQLQAIFPKIISRKQLVEQPELQAMSLLKKGNRLSIMPISQEEWRIVLALANR